MIDIYRAGAVVLSVHPSDSDKVTKKVMGENTLSLSFTLAAAFEFKIGDYLYFDAEKYTLNVLPKELKTSSTIFDYDLILEGIEYELRKVHLLFATEAMGIGGGADFSLMGNAALFARVIVANLNRIQTGWTVGSVIESATKNLTFSGDSCLTAINKVATEFSTEFWIGQDRTVNICKRGNILPVTFEYGLGKGLYSIERDNVSSKDIITRLYAFGSEQNLPKGYRGNAKRLQISTDYIEASVSKYGIIESSQNFDEIKPERTGTVSALGADIFTFIDSSMDFDINAKDINGNTLCLVPGTKAKIHFQTGALAGYEFDLASYDHAAKAFKLVEFTNEVAYKLPNDTLKPALGDTYIILDIYMPQTYVDAAEARLLAKAQESLAQNSEPQVSYKVAVDPLFVSQVGLTFKAGDYVNITDTALGINRNIRLVNVTRSVALPSKYDFDLADTVEPSLTTQILTTLERTDLVLQMNKLLDPARARRNWRTVEELRGAIYDVDGYFDAENIKPFSIETNMLTVGSKGNQFYTDCFFQANHGGSKNSIKVGNGSLAHFTIEESIRTWAVTGISETLPDDNLRYIYIVCLKAGNTAQVTLSATQKPIDEGNYYNFFAGVLSSVIDGARQISLLFGFTTINGRFVKTGRVQSADGKTYFDLDAGEIGGKIVFKSGNEYKEVGAGISEAVNNLQIGGRNYIRNSGVWIDLSEGEYATETLLSCKGGENVVFSFYANIRQAGELSTIVYGINVGNTNVSLEEIDIDSTDPVRVIQTCVVPYGLSGKVKVFVSSGSINGFVAKFQLELGTKVTDWKPASEDLSEQVSIAQAKSENAALIARALSSGKMLYRDPNFAQGTNGIMLYNNAGGTALTLVRIAAQNSPNSGTSGKELEIKYTAGGAGTSPGLGGFTFNTPARMFGVFLTKIVAKIPAGYKLAFQTNAIGKDSSGYWLTPCEGTGKYEDYYFLLKCGTYGTFSTTNFFYLEGPATTSLSWILVYATVFDTTSSESYEIAAATQTSINGGIITSGIIQLGAVDGSIKAGINGGGSSEDSVRFWAGASYDNRALAPFRVWQSGEVFARKRIELLDENNYGLAGICGSNSAGDGVIRFWAGETYVNRANAPFRVDKNGTVVMTKATLQSGTTGRRIEILSSEGILRMIGSNGQECIQLKETSYSGTVYPGVFVNLQSGDYKYVSSIEPVEIKASVYLSGAIQYQTKLSSSEIRFDDFTSANTKAFSVGSLNNALDVIMIGLPYRSTGSSGMKPLLIEVSTGRIFMGS